MYNQVKKIMSAQSGRNIRGKSLKLRQSLDTSRTESISVWQENPVDEDNKISQLDTSREKVRMNKAILGRVNNMYLKTHTHTEDLKLI